MCMCLCGSMRECVFVKSSYMAILNFQVCTNVCYICVCECAHVKTYVWMKVYMHAAIHACVHVRSVVLCVCVWADSVASMRAHMYNIYMCMYPETFKMAHFF